MFRDRFHAGDVVATMLEAARPAEGIVLAIPAGGFPVALRIAARLALPLDVAVVSKVTPSWNTEVGYGALAFDGTERFNEALADRLGVDAEERRRGVEATWRKVQDRLIRLRGGAPPPGVSARTVILIDDGLASGLTMLVAIEALEKLEPGSIVVAVPTGHAESVDRVAERADAVYCANVRTGPRFAVADAYAAWSDVSDDEVLALWSSLEGGGGDSRILPGGNGG